MSENTERPKPASYGFDLDFNDLSKTKPMPAPGARTKPQAAKADPKKDLDQSKPTRKAQNTSKTRSKTNATDRLAEGLGFTSREQSARPVVLKKRRRVHHTEPVDQLSIRGPVRVLNQFIEHCEHHNLAYWEALEKLLDTNA